MWTRPLIAFWALVASATAGSHPAPNSSLRLQATADGVHAEYWLPVSELGHAREREPHDGLSAYLLRRLSAETLAGVPWSITVRAIRDDRYLEHDFLVAELLLAPPPGQPVGRFVLEDEVITHEVRNHVILVVRKVSAGGQPGTELIGTLQYPERRLEIPLSD
jgi:hypothetical protein